MAVWGTTIGTSLSASPPGIGGGEAGGARLQSRCKCEVDPQEKHFRGVDNLGVDCLEETTFTSSNGSGLTALGKAVSVPSVRCKLYPKGSHFE